MCISAYACKHAAYHIFMRLSAYACPRPDLNEQNPPWEPVADQPEVLLSAVAHSKPTAGGLTLCCASLLQSTRRACRSCTM